MAKYRSKTAVVEAVEWKKNGDHPLDDCTLIPDTSRSSMGPGGVSLGAFLSEGKVVRYFRHAIVGGDQKCSHCSDRMRVHGWIDTAQGGSTVCPGDFIITKEDGSGFYPCKPDVFHAKYELADSTPNPTDVELEWLRFFYKEAKHAMGPADSDIYRGLARDFKRAGKLPKSYDDALFGE